jgi:thiol:disulfide interchange protein
MKRLIFLLILLAVGCNPISSDMTNDQPMSDSSSILAGTTTKYIAFNQEDYNKALEENKIILLYFYASWCPICQAEQKEVFSAFEEMDYPNVVGFRVNYRDSDVEEFEEQLAKEHGITYQHTKVIIKDGERVLKAPDSWDKEGYLKEIGDVV